MTTTRNEPQAGLRHWLRSPVLWAVMALWALLLAMEWARPCFFLHDDNATQFIAFFVHDFRVLTETGRLAEINYYQYGGEPYLEQGQTAVLYPPVYLGVALAKFISGDVRWTIEWLVAMHLTLGLLGFYYWLRQSGATATHALLGGLAWVLNPFVLIVACSWVNVSFVACYLPWIFWAFDWLFTRPSPRAAIYLGVILGLFFLQGTAQWVFYTVFFLGIYAAFRLITKTEIPRLAIIGHLALAAWVFLIVALPLLLPMLHATENSFARAKPMNLFSALTFSILKTDLFRAQFLQFSPHMVFGITSAVLFCPALLLFPLTIFGFLYSGVSVQQRLFPLLILSVLAVFLASHWHIFLSLLPVFDKFRWPFKVFIFAEFFLLASLVLSLSSLASRYALSRNYPARLVSAGLALIVIFGVAVGLTNHDGNFFSNTALPSSNNPLPSTVDPQKGRVITVGEIPYATTSYRFLTYSHGTFFGILCIGGYNPLVSDESLNFGVGLDFPNLFHWLVTPDVRQKFESRAVRYWIVDPHSSQVDTIKAMPGLTLLSSEPGRLIFEDTKAQPLAYEAKNPAVPYPVFYSGDSMFIPVGRDYSPVEISVQQTNGWWYRTDNGSWLRPAYENDRLKVDLSSSARQLEVSYFDPRFRKGIELSLCLLVVLGLVIAISKRARRHNTEGSKFVSP